MYVTLIGQDDRSGYRVVRVKPLFATYSVEVFQPREAERQKYKFEVKKHSRQSSCFLLGTHRRLSQELIQTRPQEHSLLCLMISSRGGETRPFSCKINDI